MSVSVRMNEESHWDNSYLRIFLRIQGCGWDGEKILSQRRIQPSLTNTLLLCPPPSLSLSRLLSAACKRKEQDHGRSERGNMTKKPRLVFTDVQRRTLHAIFKENKRPSKELQVTIAQQLGLELATVSNFFMNARRRSLDKWVDDGSGHSVNSGPNACTKA